MVVGVRAAVVAAVASTLGGADGLVWLLGREGLLFRR
jgi:hypothetical protein